jgi:hypothetical protein
VLLSDAQPTRPLWLLLNYDGTLVPLAQSPQLAAPDEELLSVLDELARLPGIQIDIVSARTRARRWSPSCPGPADQLGHHHVRPLSIPRSNGGVPPSGKQGRNHTPVPGAL